MRRPIQEQLHRGVVQNSDTLSTSRKLVNNPSLVAMLGAKPNAWSRIFPKTAHTYLGWGRKSSGRHALSVAKRFGANCLLLEDGFLRSVGRRDMALSMVFDQSGIYYDATGPSDLETLIPQTLTAAQINRARDLIIKWRKARVSKYNDWNEYTNVLSSDYVLVCDQTRGDDSIRYGKADHDSFASMLTAALAEYPDSTIVVKTHPDVLARAKRSYFDKSVLETNHRILAITEACHPVSLIEHARAVYAVTSQIGFEALIWGKQVRTFGMPFYAGWGLTDDNLPESRRGDNVTLEQLVHAALIRYPRYIDPLAHTPCEIERVIEHISLQRQKRGQFPPEINLVGVSRWKRRFIKNFLQGSKLKFISDSKTVATLSALPAFAVWGSETPRIIPSDSNILRIEDGFLRSAGLGAGLVTPLSLVIDDVGIYYDATKPSRLEAILVSQNLSRTQVDRARHLRNRIVRMNLTKYNVGQGPWARPVTKKRVILVVGQVETDASIRLGSPEVTTNIELLRRVREDNPGAHIVYKRHPDVVAGLRQSGQRESEAIAYCDEVVANVSANDLFGQIDALHTITSLMGFEALLRGVDVTCHGLPFYAGWGLTNDRIACERRQRHLTLDELVYGVLIAYPRYYSTYCNTFVEAENTLEELGDLTRSGPATPSWYRKGLRSAILLWLTMRRRG